MPFRFLTAVQAGLLCVCLSGQTQGTSGLAGGRVETLPHSLEVSFALSAAPPHLCSAAAIYVLDPAKGYALERKGTNGFTCYVERTDYLREDYGNGFFTPSARTPKGAGRLYRSSSTSSACGQRAR